MIYKQSKPNVFVYKVGINSLDTVSAYMYDWMHPFIHVILLF